jgi:hypothetical protein
MINKVSKVPGHLTIHLRVKQNQQSSFNTQSLTDMFTELQNKLQCSICFYCCGYSVLSEYFFELHFALLLNNYIGHSSITPGTSAVESCTITRNSLDLIIIGHYSSRLAEPIILDGYQMITHASDIE